MSTPFVWNVDPVLLEIGPLAIRWYGVFFACAISTGFFIWYGRARRDGLPAAVAEAWLWWGAAAVVVGGRLGHVLFYQPSTYLADPLRIVRVWEGGLASHGVAAGLLVALWLYGRRHGIGWATLADLFAPAGALAAGWIRLGNFFNSEILGRPADLPWAVVFARHDAVPRHPVQLYEMLMGPLTWVVLVQVERRRPGSVGSGLLAGTFLLVFFGLRIVAERFKDFTVEELRTTAPLQAAESMLGGAVHTGQWLSIVPVLLGAFLVWRAARLRPRGA